MSGQEGGRLHCGCVLLTCAVRLLMLAAEVDALCLLPAPTVLLSAVVRALWWPLGRYYGTSLYPFSSFVIKFL